MADFNTHFFVATAVGAVYATAATKGLALDTNAALLIAKALFLVLGAVLAILCMLHHVTRFSVLELLIIGAVLFIAVRYLLWGLFHQFTVHRGSLHSLAASAMFGTCAVVLCHRGWSVDADISWLAGIGVFIGSVTHLLLDELYSVDFTGARIKRSFGSAMKIVDTVRWPGSVAVVLITILSLWLAPSAGPLFKALQTMDPNWQTWLFSAELLKP